MVRILHTADVHLGRRFPSLGKNGGDYRNQLLRTFEKIGDLAISERVSLLLIAGDLFDSNRVYGITIGKVLSTFKKLETAGIQVGILPGTHDSFDGDSIYRFLKFPANVTVFTPEHSHRTYENFDLTVYGRPPAGDSWGKSPIKGLSLVQQSKFHIGMAHCSVRRTGIIESDEMLLDESEIADSGLDYLALGHWHAFQDFSRGNTRACYCGSPEPLEIEKKDNGNVVMVTVSDKNNVDFSRVHVGTKKCEVLPVDVSPAKSASGIMEMIEARADPNLILEAVLTGTCSTECVLNPLEIEEALGERFFHLRVRDSSHPQPGEVMPPNYPEETVTGRFLRIMEKRIAAASDEDRPTYEEVLKLGFALLQGRSQVIE